MAVLLGSRTLPSTTHPVVIEVWEMRQGLLGRKVFEDKIKKGVSAFNWFGSTLYYSSKNESVLEMNKKTDLLFKYLENYSWTSAQGKKQERNIYASNFSVESEDGNKLLIVDPEEVSAKSELAGNGRKYIAKGVSVRVYKTAAAKTTIAKTAISVLYEVVLPISIPTYRSSSFMPLVLSNDGNILFARCSGSAPWSKGAYSSQEFLVRINLRKGLVERLTSADEPDALFSLGNGWAAPSSPVSLRGQSVICALNAQSRNLRYRFQIFGLAGHGKEIKIDDFDARSMNAPKDAYPISWTSKGNALVQSTTGIWLVPLTKGKSHRIMSNFYVESIAQRIADNSFLLQGRIGTTQSAPSKWCIANASVMK